MNNIVLIGSGNVATHLGLILLNKGFKINDTIIENEKRVLELKDFRNKINGQVLRLALMSAHYKQPLDWNDKLLEDCKNTIEKWYEVYLPLKTISKIPDEMLLPLYDDLNTPGYIANLHKLFEKACNGNDNDKKIFISACNFVGILKQTKDEWLDFKKKKSLISEKDIIKKIELRNKARKNKEYKEADNLRKELLDKGVLIEDKNGKTIWKFK